MLAICNVTCLQFAICDRENIETWQNENDDKIEVDANVLWKKYPMVEKKTVFVNVRVCKRACFFYVL